MSKSQAPAKKAASPSSVIAHGVGAPTAKAPAEETKERKTMAPRHPPASTVNVVATALPPEKIIVGNGKDEEMVSVHVPKAFRLMDDHRHIHHYDILGNQKMPKSHAEASYAKANGVTLTDD